MPLTAGTRFGAFEITGWIGAGAGSSLLVPS
jgi:hypothetical protein